MKASAWFCWRLLPLLVLVGCGSDDHPAAEDTHTEARSPDVATAADIGGKDIAPPIPQHGPRAYVITQEHAADLKVGDMTSARVGDIVLRNDDVRFVIRSGDHAMSLYGLGGGGVVDAGEPTADRLQELLPLAGLHSISKTLVTIVGDGRSGEAIVSVTGEALVPPIIGAWIPGLQTDGVSLTHTYRLDAGAALEMTTETSQRGNVRFGDLMLNAGEMDSIINEKAGRVLTEGPSISYGLVSESEMTLADLGGVSLLFGPTLEGPDMWRRWFVVGDGSLSSVLDQALALRMSPHGTITGVVDGMEPGVVVTAFDGDGQVVSRFTPDGDGNFGGKLPPGLYSLVSGGEGRNTGTAVEVDVQDGAALTDLTLGALAASWVEIKTHDALRLTIDGKQDVAVPPGVTRVPVRPGSRELMASRGFEYEIDQTTVVLSAGEGETWEPDLVRSVDTTGWIALDSHLHSEWSVDSNMPVRERIVRCAAEGVEYAVASDHDMITDYTRFVPESLKGKLIVASGVEITTAVFGHLNVWPLVPNEDLPGRGAPTWHQLEFQELMASIPALGGVFQMNHPRGAAPLSTFDQIGFDPEAPDAELVGSFNFHAMELINPIARSYDDVLVDWLALMREGLSIAPMGVSDSHGYGSPCGHGRTYVPVTIDDPSAASAATIDAVVRSGRTMATSGPFLTVDAGSAAGAVRVRVAGPSWMPIEKIVLYEDGLATQEIVVPPFEESTVRYDQDVTLLAETTWVTAVASAETFPEPLIDQPLRAIAAPFHLP